MAREASGASARREAWLWFGQRASALVLAFAVLVHIVTIVYAIRGGLSGAEILGRTRGQPGWLVFYAVFVLAVAVHVPIGLRAIAIEWLGWRGPGRDLVMIAIGIALVVTGLAAAWGVFV